MVTHNFPAQQFVEVVLQGWKALRQFFQLREVNRADFAVLQGIRSAGMLIGTDGIQTEHFAGYMKPRHLFSAIDGQHAGLERTYAHSVQRAQRVTCPV